MARKVLILGGSRFHGLQLACFLAGKGNKVFALNRGRYKKDYPSVIKNLIADRDNPRQLKDALDGCYYDVVIDNNAYNAAQAEIVLSLIQGRCGHYIFTSTAAVYLCLNSAKRLKEDDARDGEYGLYDPRIKGYALNKLAAEEAVIKKSERLNFTVLRFPNIFGENDFKGKLSYFYYRFKDGHKVLLEKEVDCFSMIYVKDVLKVFDAAIGNTGCFSKIINVCDPCSYNYDKFFKTVYGKDYSPDKLFLKDAFLLWKDGFYLPFAWGPLLDVCLARELLGKIDFTPLKEWCVPALEWEVSHFGNLGESPAFTGTRKAELSLIKRYGREN